MIHFFTAAAGLGESIVIDSREFKATLPKVKTAPFFTLTLGAITDFAAIQLPSST